VPAEPGVPPTPEPRAPGRPLWRIVLFVLLASFALHRGAAAYWAYAGELGLAVALGFAVQSGAALATAVAIWLGRSWALGFVILLGASLLATALVVGLAGGTAAGLSALSVALVFALASAALYAFLRHEHASARGEHRHALDRRRRLRPR
jgi:hypothetical protein